MTEVIRVNATLFPELLERVDFYAEQCYEDRSTAIRQLIAEGLKNKLKHKVLEEIKEQKLTIREGAALLGVSYWEMDQMLEEEGITL